MQSLYVVSFVCEDLDHVLVTKHVCNVCSTRALAIRYIRNQGVSIDYRVPVSNSVRIPAFYNADRFYSYLISKVPFYEKKKT